MLALYDISVAFWHALLPEDEPIAMYPPRGEEQAGYVWLMKQAMCGKRRASRLFQEHMKGVLKEAGHAALKVCYVTKSITTLRRIRWLQFTATTSPPGGEPEKLDSLGEVLKHLVVVKVLDRIGPRAAEHGQYLKRHLVYINGSGVRVAGRSEAFFCDHEKPFQKWARRHRAPQDSKDLGRSDPVALDELEEVEGKLYQQDTGISIYVSSERFDIQFCVKRLSEMMTKTRKLGNLRLARLARYLVGTDKLMLRFDHQKYGDTLGIAVDSEWAGSEERYSTHLKA